jgi:hypothetical protein
VLGIMAKTVERNAVDLTADRQRRVEAPGVSTTGPKAGVSGREKYQLTLFLLTIPIATKLWVTGSNPVGVAI